MYFLAEPENPELNNKIISTFYNLCYDVLYLIFFEKVKSYLDLTKTSSTDLETKVMELNEEITVLQQSKDHLQLEVETWNEK